GLRPLRRPKPRARSAGTAWAWVISLVVAGFLLIRLVAALSGRSHQPPFPPPNVPPWGGNPNFPAPFRDQALLLAGHEDGVSAVAVAANGRTVLSGSFDRSVRLWDLDTGQELSRFNGHTAPVLAVALSADGRRALSGGLDQTVRLWDVGTGRELRRFENFRSGVTAVAFAPDGTRFAAACGFQKITHTLKNEPGQPPLANMGWRRTSRRWRSRRRRRRRRPHRIIRCASGTWRRARNCGPSPGIRMRSWRWRFRRTARERFRGVSTRRRGSGRWRPASSCAAIS